MSPAIIEPLTGAEYKERFHSDTIADLVYQVKILHCSTKIPYQSFVVAQHPKSKSLWIVQWCEMIPAPFDRNLPHGSIRAQSWMLKEDARVCNRPFNEILTAFCSFLPESLPWN